MELAGIYYDGRSAQRYPVTLSLDAGILHLSGAGWQRAEALNRLDIPAALGATPRLILFDDGARCEISNHAAFTALLGKAGIRHSFIARLENHWRYALASLFMLLGVLAATYFWGLPMAASAVADRIPPSIVYNIDEQFIEAVDGKLLHHTHLSIERQQVLAGKFMALRFPPGATLPRQILFRSSPEIGANAFALPGGTVVVLDEIVKLADHDEELFGVLAHEMGHVSEHHALRNMLQASVVALAMTWYIGDISSLLAIAPTTLLQTHYTRDFERQADSFAAETLTLNHIPPSQLADMLQKLEKAHKRKSNNEKSKWMDYLSSHPATDERIKALRDQP